MTFSSISPLGSLDHRKGEREIRGTGEPQTGQILVMRTTPQIHPHTLQMASTRSLASLVISPKPRRTN